MITPALQPVPYGYADFEEVRTEGFAYVDKTQWIEALERSNEKYPFIVNPRRFGKTLFTSMLRAYYDRNQAGAFESNFRGTYIAEHKTKLANSFHVLSFDFSGLSGKDEYRDFQSAVCGSIRNFISQYGIDDLDPGILSLDDSPAIILMNFLNAVWPRTGKTIYVIIDEYDQSTNEILARDPARFREITSATGFLKNFYARLKSATVSGPVARIFITGVVSISLDSMSSGFNIGTNLTTDTRFAGMLGFTEAEVRSLIPRVADPAACGMTTDEIVSRMRMLYDGYRFSPDSGVTTFNASMCLHYLKSLALSRKEPRRLLDPNFSGDLKKIHGMLSLGSPQTIRTVVEMAMRGEAIPIDELETEINLNEHESLSDSDLLSTLFYMGFLTFAQDRDDLLVVPNRAVMEQFFRYYFRFVRGFSEFRFRHEEFEAPVRALKAGDPEPFVRKVVQFLRDSSGINKSLHLLEGDFQTALVMAARLVTDLRVLSELEVGGNGVKGYADLVLAPDDPNECEFAFVLELKHLSKGGAKGDAVSRKLEEARRQALAYAASETIARIAGRSSLLAVAAVFAGDELAAMDCVRIESGGGSRQAVARMA